MNVTPISWDCWEDYKDTFNNFQNLLYARHYASYLKQNSAYYSHFADEEMYLQTKRPSDLLKVLQQVRIIGPHASALFIALKERVCENI